MLDHLVYLVADLEAAVRHFTALKLPPTPGGRHRERGTHNALLRLGERSYLELLAIDPRTSVSAPRWMGIDEGRLPRISRWAVHAGANIVERATALGITAEVQAGQRQLPSGEVLRWQLTDPGVEPAVGTLPFLIAWPESGPHPADNLPDLGLTLDLLTITDPAPTQLTELLQRIGYEDGLSVVKGPAGISAKMNGPEGRFFIASSSTGLRRP